MKYNWELPGWPNFSFNLDVMQGNLYKFAEEVGLVNGMLKATDQNAQNEILVQTILIEALKTSEIENEYLSRQDVMSSIKNNLDLNDKIEHVSDKKAAGIAKLMTDVREFYKENLTKEKLFEWHSYLVFRHKRMIVGDWRQGDEPMQIISGTLGKEIVHFEAPPSSKVPKEMDIFIKWFNDTAPNGKDEISNAVVRAAIAHLYFENIHPFEDGNGRIGRAIAQKALSQTLKRPIILSLSRAIEEDRKAYYSALQQGSISNEITNWLAYFAEITLKAQQQVRELIDFTIKKVKFFDEFEDKLNQRQIKAINKMFNAGPNGFEGGMTAKKYMSITGAPKATATRDLQSLNELGIFPFLGEGRNVNYQIMEDLYSLVIEPSAQGIEYVTKLKDELFNEIRWYNSRNSKAHLTIIEFTAKVDDLDEILENIKQIASYEKPLHLNFKGVGNYSNGAVFLKPDDETKVSLTELMIRIQKQLNIKKSYNSKDPHISIGRKLSSENVEKALKMFSEAKLNFECKNLVLRKFNPEKKQYDYFSKDFPFVGKPSKPNAQQTLF